VSVCCRRAEGRRRAGTPASWPTRCRRRRRSANAERRTREDLSKMEISRCLKCYLAGEVFRAQHTDLRELQGPDDLWEHHPTCREPVDCHPSRNV